MSPRYVVVDGSNIATEGRSVPSLAQLDEAVRAFMEERPSEQVIVVVDASFGYRIDESERNEYEQAEVAGEIVSPPAGAIGRGDGFLLRIADRTDAVVLSNDSFQEFHAEYPWLFDQGRLIGGKPVPAVGWIFTPRAPVRGPRSREAMRLARKAQKASLKRATVAEGPVAEAIAQATAEVIAPGEEAVEPEETNGEATKGGRRARWPRHGKPAGTVNDPLPFIQFIADHPLGTEVIGEVESFTSHGAFVKVEGTNCYVPLVALGDPPPRSAKSVLKRGEIRPFVVQALDPPRRGIELAMPELARVAGTPTEETVEADIGAGRKARKVSKAAAGLAAAPTETVAAAAEPAPKRSRPPRRKAAPAVPAPVAAAAPEPEAPAPAPAKSRRTRKAPSKAAAGPEAVPEVSPEPPAAEVARPRRARKAAAPAASPEPAVSEPAPAPATPKKAGRKRAPAKAVEPVAAPEPEPTPAKKAARKRAAPSPEPEAAPVAAVKKAARKRAAPGPQAPRAAAVKKSSVRKAPPRRPAG